MRTATQKEIDFINAYRAMGNLQAEDVYVQAFLVANTSFIEKYSMFFHPKAVKQMSDKAGLKDDDGVNFKVMHDRYKVISLGKSFAGAYDDKNATAYAKFYFPRGHYENGYTTEDLIRGIETGIYAATSWGLPWPIKSKSIKCSLCGGNPLWFRKYLGGDGEWCGHWPGDKYQVTEAIADFIKKMKTEGMDSYPGETIKVDDEVECRMWLMDTEGKLDELSVVDRGASDSKPLKEDAIPVKFSVAKDHPAFRLAANKGSDSGVKDLLGKDLRFQIDGELEKVELESDEDRIEDIKDIKLLGEQKDQIIKGGDKEVDKTFSEKLKMAIKVFKDGEVSESSENASAMLAEVQAEVERLEGVVNELKGKITSLEAEAKKYQDIPEEIRTKIEDTTLTWALVVDYIKVCQKELDGICTDLCNAAVAAKGNEVKEEDLKAEIMTKVRAFGLEAAIDHGRRMIKAYQDSQKIKPGQKADTTALDDDDPVVVAAKEAQALKDKATAALAKKYGNN